MPLPQRARRRRSFNGSGTYQAGTLIAETVLAAPAASITFSSIPATYRKLHLEVIGASNTAATNTTLCLTFNGSAGTNYSDQAAQGADASAAGVRNSGAAFISLGLLAGATAPANQPGLAIVDIPLYAGTTFRKVLSYLNGMSADDTTGQVVRAGYGVWKSTAAINSMTISPGVGSLITGSLARLYGIG